MFIRVDPGTGARIHVCSGSAVASKTGECPPITASRSEFHAAGLDATCQGKSAETSGSRLKKRKAVAALLESPSGKKKSITVPWADLESTRSKLLQKLAQDLECPKFGVYFQTIMKCRAKSVFSVVGRSQGELSGQETAAVVGSGQKSASQNSSPTSVKVVCSISDCFDYFLFHVFN